MALKLYPGLFPIGDNTFVATAALAALLPAGDGTEPPSRTTLLLRDGTRLYSALSPQTVAERYARSLALLSQEDAK